MTCAPMAHVMGARGGAPFGRYVPKVALAADSAHLAFILRRLKCDGQIVDIALPHLIRHCGHAQGVVEPGIAGIVALVSSEKGDHDDEPGTSEDPHGDEDGPSNMQRCTDGAARAQVLATLERK